MGGIGGALYAGFMLQNEDWVKIYNALMKEIGKTNTNDEMDDEESRYNMITEICEIIGERHPVDLRHFLRGVPGWGYQESDPTGLGVEIMCGGGPDQMTFEEMEENMKIKEVLKKIGQEYGLGEPRLYMIDVECY